MSFLQLLIKLSSVSVFTSAIVLVTSMILGKIMEPQHFGEYSFLQSILMILVNVSSMAASLAISVFMYRSPQNKLNRILNNTLFTVLPIFLLVGFLVIVLIGVYTSNFNGTLFLLLINVVMMSVCLLGIDYLRMKQNIRLYSILFLGYTSSIALFSVMGYLIGKSVFYIYLASALALTLPLCYTLHIFLGSFSIQFNFKKKLKTYIWSLKYGTPVVCSTVAMSFLVIGDKIILGSFVSKAELAQYSIAALLSSTTLFLVNNFASAWSSYLFKNIPKLTEHGRRDIKPYYNNLKFRLFAVIPVSFIIYPFQYLIYFLFFSKSYPDLGLAMYALTLGYCIFGASKYFMGFLNYFSRNIIILYTALGGSLLMALLTVFVFDFSILGTAFAVLLAFLFQFLVIWQLTDIEVNRYIASN